ncbi:gas vesicle protein [Actinopolymorpha alba]|uniref:gas vesicle protein GvpO n=1 Tax=Actinopolymorpha alba TaxID=533267 RepID=UPI0003724045|nr:gas vesicle protein [Actinopolymorpha alba]
MADGRAYDQDRPERASPSRQGTPGAADAMAVSRTAMDQLSMLTGRPTEGISRLEQADDGWHFQIEVVELERVPDSTSVLASYEAKTDDSGNVVSYKRTRRYTRNQAGEL